MTDDPFDVRIETIFETMNARSDNYVEVLKQTDDLTSVLLKGHLIVEELLTAGIQSYCRDSGQLREARLRFGQRVALLRALERTPSAPQEFWEAVLHLNRLRNELAHNLDHTRVPALSGKFVRALENYRREGRFPRPLEGREALLQALHFLIGGLEVVAVWQQGVEELVAHRLRSPNRQPSIQT